MPSAAVVIGALRVNKLFEIVRMCLFHYITYNIH